MAVFKITIENVESGKTFSFYEQNLYMKGDRENALLSGKYFDRSITDAKSGETFTIKEKIIKEVASE